MKKRFDFFPGPDGRAGRVVFYFDKHDDSREIDTGWLKSGLPDDEIRDAFLVTALVTEGSKKLFGAVSLFDEVPGVLGKAKTAAAIDEKNGKIRFAVRLKSPETVRVALDYRVISKEISPAPAEAVNVPTAEDLAPQVARILQENAAPAAEPAAEKAAPAPAKTPESAPDEDFYIENAPAAIHCGWKYTLRAHIPAGKTGTVRWEISEENGGTIDRNGQYTAPDKPGAYEIRACFEPEADPSGDTAGGPGGEPMEASVYLIVL